MIKNKLIFIIAIGFLFFPSAASIAVETVDTNTIKTTKLETSKNTEEYKAKLKKDIENRFNKDVQSRIFKIADEISRDTTSKKIKLSKVGQDNLKNILSKIYNKFNDKISKLSIIDNKISIKISTLEQEGRDVTAIIDQYDTAKTALINSRIEIAATNNFAFDQISQQTSKETMRKLVKKAEDNIKNTGEEYRKILPMLSKLEGDNSINN